MGGPVSGRVCGDIPFGTRGDGGLELFHGPCGREMVDGGVSVLATEGEQIPVVVADAEPVVDCLAAAGPEGQPRASVLACPRRRDDPVRADAELLDRVAENAPQRADVIAQEVHIARPVEVGRGRQQEIGIVHVVARVHRGEDAQDGDFAGTRVAEADAQSRDVVAAQSQLVDRHIHVNGHTGGGIGGDFERDLARFGKAGRRRPPLHVRLQRRCARNELDANPGRRLGIDIDRR